MADRRQKWGKDIAMIKKRKRIGDRKDGVLLRNLDSMHLIVPMLYPNRCDNEAFISELIDLTAINDYLAEKNAAGGEYPLKLFNIIVAALAKTITLRPKMNRFIANKNMYQRNERTAAFVVKKEFADEGREALAMVHFSDDDTIDTIHAKIVSQIVSCRGQKADKSTESMDIFSKLPRFITKFIVAFTRILDRHGLVPSSLIATDPYYASVVLSNLGSIKLKAGYHHLTNWGTNSVFVTVGEKKIRPIFADDGTYRMCDSLTLGLTVDERIADGYYYSKTVRLLKKLLENPGLLELPISEEVEY